MDKNPESQSTMDYLNFVDEVLNDYKIITISRECGKFGRREVLNGRGSFGIFGDGKELPQVVLSRFFRKGDFRSGYYRDKTILLAQGLLRPKNIFANIYSQTDLDKEPMSGGRQMLGHFLTPMLDENQEWLDATQRMNHISDVSPTATQMLRLLGLAQASKIYRDQNIENAEKFSNKGKEVAWGTIGNASTSEGIFFESVNAAGILQVPLVISVWDDGYGISVSSKYQTTKESISEILAGFQRTKEKKGCEILSVNGWDYAELLNTYAKADKLAREEYVPVIVHVKELTQPFGHSTSGSHERYKSKKRLDWEDEMDCNQKMRQWIIDKKLATEEDLVAIEKACVEEVRQERNEAWEEFQNPIVNKGKELLELLNQLKPLSNNHPVVQMSIQEVTNLKKSTFKDVLVIGKKVARELSLNKIDTTQLQNWISHLTKELSGKFNTFLSSSSKSRVANVKIVNPVYPENPEKVDGRVILRDNFDKLFETNDRLFVFGEDVGKIGGVNQSFEGLQTKYGEERIFDVGIREASLVGQGIGMALRGLRPIAEIQYLDYIYYCLQVLTDDVATLLYRSVGRQKVPLIIRTRGHRLEGIWHSGSPLGAIVNSLRGMNVLVPRNMTQAAGFYNTLLQCDEPALLIESLNGYRIKENKPSNLGEYTIPLGKIEVLKEGSDITLISYGSTLRLVQQVAKELVKYSIDVEVIDVQTLLPFDLNHDIVKSVAKTNLLLIVDEDVPGGAGAYILHELIEKQNIYNHLDASPSLLAAKNHRPSYGTDGDYFSKPSFDDIFDKVISIFKEYNPKVFGHL